MSFSVARRFVAASFFLAPLLASCGGDPEAGDRCEFQEIGDFFCAGASAVLQCGFDRAGERVWLRVQRCEGGQTCRLASDARSATCE
jgi:hypothetical protein